MTTHSIDPSAGRRLASSFAGYLGRAALVCSALFALSVTAAESSQPPAVVASVAAADAAATKLEQVRAALSGQNKEPERAKKLLLEIVDSETRQATLRPSELSYAYVYLGYIADRAGRREEAVSWYKRALELEQGDTGIQECAADGLKRPLIWIRHLDEGTSPPSPSSTARPGEKGYVTNQPPAVVASVAAADAAATELEQVRAALSGQNKEPERAKKLLLEIVESETRQATLEPSELCHTYVYLGYIADRAGQRDEAVSWYKRALETEPVNSFIHQLAAEGVKKSVTWIRHLDQATSPTSSNSTTRPPEKGYVTTEDFPKDMVPAKELSAQQRQENFEFLCDAIDKTYACFELKRIDWGEVCQRYRSQLGQTKTADDFYRLLFQLVAELKDTHSWLQNFHVALPSSGPSLTVELFEGRPFVVAVKPASEAADAGIGPGAEILKIDGQRVQERMDALRKQLPGRSTQRAFQREATRYLLAGDKGTTVSVTLRSPGASTNQTCSLKRTEGLGAMPHRTYAFGVTRQRFVHFGRHPSGAGYIRIESFNGRQEIATEFDRALEALKDTPALILDVRGNPGGFGNAQPHIVGRFITNHTLVAISYRKNGPAHGDLDRQEDVFEPAGEWQYRQPMALLIDDETGSAADLFTCYMRSTGRVLTVGSPTHGNLSGVAAYAVLPCGLIVRISNGYICDAGGRPIESNGNLPEVCVSPTLGDLLSGKDPVLEKSAALLQEKCPHASNQN